MVAGSSSKWLPPGFEVRIDVKNGRKIKCYYNVATGMKYDSKKDVMVYLKTQEIFHDPQEISNDENGLSFNNEVDEFSVETNKSPEWLPNGWRMEEKPRKKGSKEGSKYKIYIDLSTGNKFYSKLAVARYLKNVDPNDSMVVQPKAATEGTSAGEQLSSESGYISGRKKKGKRSLTVVASECMSTDGLPLGSLHETRARISRNRIKKDPLDNGGVTLTLDVPLACKSMSDDDCIPKTRKRKHSFMMVASEITVAEGLPPGWTKEIKTSKSGNKIRKDPYYVDPVNGYIFHSKKDALRYLETNDISSCAIIPKRQKLVENTTPPMGNQQCKPRTHDDCIADAETKENSKQSFPTSANESTYVEGLPPGWMKEVQTRKSGRKIRKDNCYIDPVNGYMFRSKKDVTRYLESNDVGSCAITSKRMKLNGPKLIKNKIHIENVVQPCLKQDTYIQSQSMIDAARIIKNLKKNQDSSTDVAMDIASSDGLPPGWTKEIKCIKSGNKIRKDAYYTDPVSGYIFHSEKDALRFLELNDVGNCAITPKKREYDDPKLINSKTTHLSPTNQKLPDYHEINEKLFSGGESNIHGGNNSGVKTRAALKTRISKIAISGGKSLQDSTTVAIESTEVDGLPPGWVKEIKTSKSGNKTRKDPYYTDPVSGYIFRSKKDVFRFLETKDIGSCVITPKKRESDDLKLINKIPGIKPSSSSKRKLSGRLGTKFIFGKESRGNGGDSSSPGSLAASNADITNTTVDVANDFQVSTAVATEITPADGLPPGWTREIKTIKSGNRIRKDPYYVDPVSGYIFRSKKDVFRFLETNDIRSCAITPKKRESDDLKLTTNKTTTSLCPSNRKFSDCLETRDKLFCVGGSNISGENNSGVKSLSESKAKSSKIAFAGADNLSFEYPTMVASEITSADGLPPGWLKEIKICKSGDKIRKDPYYTDPVSGFIFRSKKDALRYLETNDIGSCAIRPKKRVSEDPKLINSEAPSSSPSNGKFSDHLETKDKLFYDGRSNISGEDSSGVKSLSTSMAKSSKVAFAGADSHSFEDPAMVTSEITSAHGLPAGWLKEIKICKSGNKIRRDPYYTDPVSGYVFRSRKSALRYLETNDIGNLAIRPKKRGIDDLKVINNEATSLSPANQKLSDHIETQHKLFSGGEFNGGGDNSSGKNQAESKAEISNTAFAVTNNPQNPTTVSVEITSADGLPPGWMKEVKTSYSGNKIRKDPLYYIDPVDGYIFRSRKDVLRFLETNDIGSCTMRPMKRKSDDHKLTKDKNTIAVATKSKSFSGGGPKNGVGDSFDVECLAGSESKISNIGFNGASTFTSSDSIPQTKIGTEQTNACSERGLMAEVLDICSFINESSTEDKLPESEMEKRTDGTRLRPRKSVIRRDLSLLSHSSERFSKSEPEMISHMDLNEQPIGVPVDNSSVYNLPEKDVAISTLSGKAAVLEEEQLNKDGKLPSEGNNVFEKGEKLLAEDKVILTGRTEGNANGNGLKPSYAFGESWTDPCLRFAFKTLTEEITMEETLSSPGIPENQEGQGMVRAEQEVTTTFESNIPPGFEKIEENKIPDKLPGIPFSSSPAGSSKFQVDEIPPGFESIVQNSAVNKFPPSP